MNIQELVLKAISIEIDDFYLIESELFIELYNIQNKPDFITVLLNLSSWMGTSMRSGVWTYYESADLENIDVTRKYISEKIGDEELINMYTQGINDYGNEIYQDNYDYPQEWLDESEQIDKWINLNMKLIIKIFQDILRDNLEYFSN